jgi:hypothetical protein
MKRLAMVCLAVTLAGGCNCNQKTAKKAPKIELPTADGMSEVMVVDFGKVQVNAKATHKLTVRNDGPIPLDVDMAMTAAPFGVDTTIPVEVETGATQDLVLTFTPTTPDQVVMGMLTIHSNDPDRPTVTITLQGEGIAAVARFTPDPIDFGNVYDGEQKTVNLTLTNAGTSDLQVLKAEFDAGTVPGTTTDTLSMLLQTLGMSTSAQASLTWHAAAGTSDDLTGTVDLTFPPETGFNKSAVVKGHRIYAVPQLCFLPAGGTETCADINNPSLQLNLGAFCDQAFYADSGIVACTDGGFSGSLYVRNGGNTPVSYSMMYQPYPYGSARCDGGSPASDFVFSNAMALADGGYPWSYMVSTTQLPMNATDPMPWQSMPVNVTYTARSKCVEDGADHAQLVWTRQGDPAGTTRMPQDLFINFNAQSLLPHGVPSNLALGTLNQPFAVPHSAQFFGVNNGGTGPLEVDAVELWDEFLVDGGGGTGPNGGFFQACLAGTTTNCNAFAWDTTDGGDPNQHAPYVLAGTPNQSMPTQQVLGSLVFGPGGLGTMPGQVQANTQYIIYAVIAVHDYAPTCQFYTRAPGPCVIAKITGVAAP